MTRPDSVRRASESEPAWLGGVVLVGEDRDEYGAAAVDVLRVEGWSTAVRVLDVDVGGESRVGAEVEEKIERTENASEGESVAEQDLKLDWERLSAG